MPKGRIKLNKATAGHRETLEKLGYEVKEVEFKGSPHLEVECEGFVTEPQDFRDPEKATKVLRQLIKERKLFTYTTVFTLKVRTGQTEDGTDIFETQEHKSVYAVRKLPITVTALIVKPIVKKPKKAKPTSNLDIDLGDL